MSNIQDGTGSGLVSFWDWVGEKGIVKESTAGARRTAITEVLDALADDPDQIDVRTLDVSDALRRFENLKSAKYTPGSLNTYKSRFRSAVEEYLQYLDEGSDWQPGIQARTRKKKKKAAADNTTSRPESQPSSAETPHAHSSWPSEPRLIEYPFPVREGVVAVLKLPSDLTASEARRLGAWLDALALPDGANGGSD